MTNPLITPLEELEKLDLVLIILRFKICRMERATLGGSNCPCQEDYGQGHCWCYAVISHDPVLSTLEAPYYENPFEVVPIDGEYFIENVIVTHFEQTTSNLPNWKL